ncbi:hypothetical protein [Rhodoferax aquaticus]|uniref:hypothetical protein n=1 Tax=Rhodoferax aquaticus TaxID=2527691 RepID=UPI00143DC1B7|nr:hypothetical protein [Rhodoferax aquaticus]
MEQTLQRRRELPHSRHGNLQTERRDTHYPAVYLYQLEKFHEIHLPQGLRCTRCIGLFRHCVRSLMLRSGHRMLWRLDALLLVSC